MNLKAIASMLSLGLTQPPHTSHKKAEQNLGLAPRRFIEIGTIAGWLFIGVLFAVSALPDAPAAYVVERPHEVSPQQWEAAISAFRAAKNPQEVDTALITRLIRESGTARSIRAAESHAYSQVVLATLLCILLLAGLGAVFASKYHLVRPLLSHLQNRWNSYPKAHRKRWILEVIFYISLTLGIFVRQNFDLRGMRWSAAHFSVGGFTASCMVALAIFPYAMRKIAGFKAKPGLELLSWPFSIGFFLDAARLLLVSMVPKVETFF